MGTPQDKDFARAERMKILFGDDPVQVPYSKASPNAACDGTVPDYLYVWCMCGPTKEQQRRAKAQRDRSWRAEVRKERLEQIGRELVSYDRKLRALDRLCSGKTVKWRLKNMWHVARMRDHTNYLHSAATYEQTQLLKQMV